MVGLTQVDLGLPKPDGRLCTFAQKLGGLLVLPPVSPLDMSRPLAFMAIAERILRVGPAGLAAGSGGAFAWPVGV